MPIGTAVTTMDCSAADHVEVSCAPTNALTTANPTTPKIEAITPAMIALMPTLGILRHPFHKIRQVSALVFVTRRKTTFAVGINYTKKRKSQHLTLCLACPTHALATFVTEVGYTSLACSSISSAIFMNSGCAPPAPPIASEHRMKK